VSPLNPQALHTERIVGSSMQQHAPWPADARRDRLIGDWHLYQRTGGHRTSTDDLITAWYAVHRSRTRPKRYLDLGCGVGSVLLMVSHRLQPEVSVGLEAQAQSVTMARRAIAELPPCPTDIRVEHVDFREVAPEVADGSYDLVTGSPPYFPLDAGVLPADAQRRACRFEERGGVEAYLEAAARTLRPSGALYLVFQTRSEARVLAAAAQQRMHLTGRADFLMTLARNEPFLSVYEFARAPSADLHRFACAVRDAHGALTPEYRGLRCELGVHTATSQR
jgi:tRNA1(Val) A37 N6-methylase TrmN6